MSLLRFVVGSGGMPSSHAASVSALCTSLVVTEGFASQMFAIVALFCIIVMTDAVGVRQETGKQSKALNLILKDMFKEQPPEAFSENFRELIGHTPLQVACGAITGVAIAILLHLIHVFAV